MTFAFQSDNILTEFSIFLHFSKSVVLILYLNDNFRSELPFSEVLIFKFMTTNLSFRHFYRCILKSGRKGT